jgi:hypothetical protein
MILYRDFYGGDLLDVLDVGDCTTKEELAGIIEKHRSFMESMLADAHSHLDNFKKEIGLSSL